MWCWLGPLNSPHALELMFGVKEGHAFCEKVFPTNPLLLKWNHVKLKGMQQICGEFDHPLLLGYQQTDIGLLFTCSGFVMSICYTAVAVVEDRSIFSIIWLIKQLIL